MKVICAWCGTHLKGKPHDNEVSHGICQRCLRIEKLKIKKIKELISGVEFKLGLFSEN